VTKLRRDGIQHFDPHAAPPRDRRLGLASHIMVPGVHRMARGPLPKFTIQVTTI
jgi:hypothetical protein